MDEDDEDSNSTSRLFPGIPENKRVGILRTFHHKMYEDEEREYAGKKSWFKRITDYYCTKNKCFGFCISISFAFIVIGILSIVYGFMLPPLYQTLDAHENAIIKSADNEKAQLEKEAFQITGIAFISFALVAITFSIFIPLYRDTATALNQDKEGVRTPIIVDYEIAPYSLKPGYYNFSDSTSDYTPSPSGSPVSEHVSFKSFYIQQDITNTVE